MPAPVFISYARKTSAAPAKALRDALGADTCFLDTEDIELGDSFPKRLTDALLSARVVVAFVDQAYFQRWYCLREWLLARAPFDAVLKRGERPDAPLLQHVVVAIGPDVDDRVLQRLPPVLRTTNWPSAGATEVLARLVRSKLESLTLTLDARLNAAAVAAEARQAMVAASMIPDPLRLAGLPVFPQSLPGSLHKAFVGRANELWRLHAALTESSLDSMQAAALTGALQGGGGFGKTQLAREYLHRFGPAWYRGGCFWIDASDGLLVERQLHGVLASLRPGLPSIEAMREAQRDVRAELSAALHAEAATTSMLFVVDNVPEPTGASPPPLDTWCPALGKVTCVATSRKRIHDFGWVETLDVDVLDVDAAISLLTRDVRGRTALGDDEWSEIAAWVGRLPLALTLLNASLRMASLLPHELLDRSRTAGPTALLDAQCDALRDKVPEGALRGITEAFEASYLALGEEAKVFAQRVAWLAAAPIADDLLARLVEAKAASTARGTLVERSFLLEARASSASGWSGWQMHRILADFLRTLTHDPSSALRANLSSVASALEAVDLDRAAARYQGLSFVPHAIQLVTQVGERQTLPASKDERAKVLMIVGLLETLGDRTGERQPLEAAVRLLQAAAPTREDAPLEWARTQGMRGNVLQKLGAQDADTPRLEEALSAYRAALEEFTRERAPFDWAATQNNLGNLLKTLGARQGGTERLKEAVVALRAALQEYTRERRPQEWAKAQNNLGTVLITLGARQAGTARLEEAVAAFRAALEEFTSERTRDWAITQNNLGIVLKALGERESGTARFEEAVAAYKAALEDRTRERAPWDWAMTQSNLGDVLRELGERETGTARLEEAVAACRAALEERTRERSPMSWAITQSYLGMALKTLGKREAGTARLTEALAAFHEALRVFESGGTAHYASKVRDHAAEAQALFEERSSSL
jgi:tetratricopeptide (TPR) repeat protein